LARKVMSQDIVSMDNVCSMKLAWSFNSGIG